MVLEPVEFNVRHSLNCRTRSYYLANQVKLAEILKVLKGDSPKAGTGSVSIGGNSNAPVTVINGVGEDRIEELIKSQFKSGIEEIKAIQSATANSAGMPSDSSIRDAVDAHLDAEIDAIAKLTNQNKPNVALTMLQSLYARVALTASGRIRFRIKANIGICHYVLNDEAKASELLLEAYAEAPTEPKAISNKVLALLLQDKFREAFDFGIAELKQDPKNETLAGYVVQVSRHIADVQDPLENIPPGLVESVPVLVARIYYLQHKASASDWRPLAISAAKKYPNDHHLVLYAADAKIGQVFDEAKLVVRHKLTEFQRATLTHAVAELRKQWDERITSDGKNIRPEHEAILANLLTVYFALGDTDGILAVANEALRLWPQNTKVLEAVATMGLQSGLIHLTKNALKNAPDTPSFQFLRFHINALTGDFAAISTVAKETIAKFPEMERKWSEVFWELARLKSSEEPPEVKQVAALYPNVDDDPRPFIVYYKLVSEWGFEDLANQAYQRAVEMTVEGTHIAARQMVGREAAARGEWPTAANTLDGYVDVQTDSPELLMLATAYCNIVPVSDSALSFFDTLLPAIKDDVRYQLLHGTALCNRGDLLHAEGLLRNAFAQEPANANILVVLCFCLLRQDKNAEVVNLLRMIDLSKVYGGPPQKINLAQLLTQYGRAADAPRFAYHLLCTHPENAIVALRFIGLFLSDTKEELDVPSLDKVAKGCWFQLKDQHNEKFSACIGSMEVPVDTKFVPETHPLALLSMGKKVGDTFIQHRKVGPTLNWTVAEVKHPYLHALHDAMEHYETRFPGHPALFKVNTRATDIDAVLQIVKDKAERQQEVLARCVEHRFPLEITAGMLSCDVLSAAGALIAEGHTVFSNNGNLEELNAKLASYSSPGEREAVLDTYTAWFLASNNLLPFVRKAFKRILLPRATVDQLQEINDRYKSAYPSSIQVFWKDGNFYRSETTQQEKAAWLSAMATNLETIRKYCHIEPQVGIDSTHPIINKAIEVAGSHFWDAAALAARRGAILVSDDQSYRSWATVVLGVNDACWIQAVFKLLIGANVITGNDYTSCVLALAAHRHDFLSIDAKVLEDIYDSDDLDLRKLEMAVYFIGTKTADMTSHVKVCRTFIHRLWSREFNPKVGLATSIVLSKLIRYTPEWPTVIALMLNEGSRELAEYLESWCIGHLLPVSRVVEVQKRIIDNIKSI